MDENADALVGLPGRSQYQASGSVRPHGEWWHFRRDGGPKGTQMLSAKGFQLDIVSQVKDIALGGMLPKT